MSACSPNSQLLLSELGKHADTYCSSGPKSKGKKTDTQTPASTPAVKVKAIRARVGTTLAIENGQLVLTSTGDDPGLTFDASDIKAAGPYTLTFRLQSSASGDGEIY